MSNPKRLDKKEKEKKTRNKILFSVLGGMGIFILYTIVFYSIKGWPWDGLFPYVLGIGGVVDVATAAVAIVKTKHNKEDNDYGIQDE